MKRPLSEPELRQRFESELPEIMERFYDALFSDLMIGFFFTGKDKAALIEAQSRFTRAALGGGGAWEGPSMVRVHKPLKIFSGQFFRRHQILKEVLESSALPEELREAWLALDLNLKNLIVFDKSPEL
jgi:truncated hemoglobin YjbI